MSKRARDWARSVGDITASEAIVLRELAEYYNDDKGEAWPSIEVLKKTCHGINEKTIRRALSSLMTQGHITRTQRGTRHQASKYALHFNRTFTPTLESLQPDIGDLSTGHPIPINRTSTPVQPDIYAPQQGKEPLTTVSEPLLEPASAEFFKRTIHAYEANIGMMTPMVAERINAIADEDSPPPSWGEDAIRIAVENGARNWSYTSAVLNRWISQGSQDNRKKTGATDDGRIQGPGIDTLRGVAHQAQ